MTQGSATYKVWCRLTASALPSDGASIGGVHFSDPPRALLAESDGADLAMEMRARAPCAVYGKPRATVFSDSFAWMHVEAVDGPTAIDVFERQHGPMLQATLSMSPDAESCRLQLLGAEGPEGTHFAYHEFGVTSHDGRRMAELDIREAERRWALFHEHAYARRASLALIRAASLHDMGSDVAVRGASILACHQAIEAIAHGTEWKPQSDLQEQQEQQERLINSLRNGLNSRRASHKKLAYIREINRQLNRLDAIFLSDRIAFAADLLGMSAQWKGAAARLGKLRNTKLGHTGDPPSSGELHEWCTDLSNPFRAQPLARAIVHAYVNRLLTAGPPFPERLSTPP